MIGLALAMMLSGTAQTPGPAWKPYTNVRYGYSTCYPSRLLTAEPEASAGDGRVFSSHDGAELRVWAHYATSQPTDLRAEAIEEERSLTSHGGSITYRASQPGWVVVSGRSGFRIFWAKIVQQGDRIVTVQFVHPVSLSQKYGKMPDMLNRCSTIGTAAF